MAFASIITPVSESEATGQVRTIFNEIKSTMGVQKVPLIFRMMARLPMYLETSWQRCRFAYYSDGRLDRRTKWMIALAISASNNNKAMILESTERLKEMGVTDADIAELMAVVDVTNGLSKVLKAAQVSYGQ